MFYDFSYDMEGKLTNGYKLFGWLLCICKMIKKEKLFKAVKFKFIVFVLLYLHLSLYPWKNPRKLMNYLIEY